MLDLDLDPGDYHIRVEGQWKYNETTEYVEQRYNTAGYVFCLSVPGTVELVSECESTQIGGDLSIALRSLTDRLRTAVDSANRAGCRFNKPIARVLIGTGQRRLDHLHGDLATSTRRPSPSASLCRKDTASESSGGPLPPGDYSRRLTAFTADGEQWKVPDDFFLLETVTIAER